MFRKVIFYFEIIIGCDIFLIFLRFQRFFVDFRDFISWVIEMKVFINVDELVNDVVGVEVLLDRY